MKHFALTLLLVGILGGASAEAACTSPAGVESEMKWIAPNMKYCNNTVWQAMNDTVTGTACTGAGKLQYNTGKVQYCNGSFWVESAPNTDHGACAPAQAGYFYYDTTGKYYWFCNSANWRRMGP